MSAPTIQLTLPNFAEQGFGVNGALGAITSSGAGFFSNGLPAVLGSTLDMTYGLAPVVASSNPIEGVGVSELIQAVVRVSSPTALLETQGSGGGGGASQFKVREGEGAALGEDTDRDRTMRHRPSECR